MSIYDLLSEKFDIIFLLTMSNRRDRMNAALDQLRFIGRSPIDTKLHIQYGTTFPYNNLIAKVFNTSNKGRFTKVNEFDCSRNHYSMVKQAYDNPLCEHVLIIEDDIQFLNNEGVFYKFLKEIPNDYDIIQFGGFTTDKNVEKYLIKDINNISETWVKHPDIGLWNASMYALSRKGMQFYLAFMDKFFWVADGPLYKAPINSKIVNTYMSTIPLVIQADKNIVSSDIRDKQNDEIDYNTQNLYEKFISKDKYFKY